MTDQALESQQQPLLQLRGLHTSFLTNRGEIEAVASVDLDVHAGETIGIVGESGSGKSVTARSILRLLPRNSTRIGPGEVLFEGRNLLELSEKEMRRIRGKEIALIFQDPMTGLNPVMTVGDQISESIAAHSSLPRARRLERVVELLQLVGIPSAHDRLRWYPHEFSGGMRQRVMIAMALSCRPRLLLADEITTALDVTLQAQILELMASLSASLKMATVIITHDLGVVAGMTQRVYVMYAGRIVESARTSDLFAAPAMPYTWGLLRSAPDLEAPEVDRLIPIEGLPPDLANPPPGCRFAPRCTYRRQLCIDREPALAPACGGADGHMTRCWGTQAVEGGGWLLGMDWRRDLGDAPAVTDARELE